MVQVAKKSREGTYAPTIRAYAMLFNDRLFRLSSSCCETCYSCQFCKE